MAVPHAATTTINTLQYAFVWSGPEGTRQTNGSIQLRFPPNTTPLLIDYDDFHPRSAASGKNVVFMDGHVTALDLPELP